MTKNPTSRRDFLTVGSLGFLGLTLRDTLAATAASPGATAKANSVILFWLEGGPSHIDTFDPKPNSNFRPMSTNVAGIQVSELLPKLAKRRQMALVRSMHTRGNDHPQATHYVRHRPRDQSGDAVPEPRLDRLSRTQAAQCCATPRSGPEVGPRPPIRGLLPRGVPRRRARPDVHPGLEQA